MTIPYKKRKPRSLIMNYGNDFRLERIIGLLRYEVEMDKLNNVEYLGIGKTFNLLDKEIHSSFEGDSKLRAEYELIIKDIEEYNKPKREPMKTRGLRRDAEANTLVRYKKYSDKIYCVPKPRFTPRKI